VFPRRRAAGLFLPAVLAALFAPAVFCPANARADFDYPDFSSTAGLNLQGSAAVVNDGISDVLRLTPATGSQIGSAFNTTAQQVVTGFGTQFDFDFTDPGGISDGSGNPGGDGVAFNLASALPGSAVFASSEFSVLFDTFQNAGDPGSNFVRVLLNGATFALTGDLTSSFDFSNGDEYRAEINTIGDAAGTLEVTLINLTTNAAPQVVISQTGFSLAPTFATGTAFAGLGAFTGGAFENHDIISFALQEGPEPLVTGGVIPEPGTLILALGGGLLPVVGFVRRRLRR